MRNGVQVRLLGPLEVTVDGHAVDVSGARLRGLLALLAIDAPHVVPSSALIDALWPDEPPADAANALQSLVSRLRRAIGDPTAVVQTGAGYQLAAQLPVMPIGGFNGSDPSPTLAQFKQYVADGEIHYFIASGGNGGGPGASGGTSSTITAWVTANFTAKTVDGLTVYDLSGGIK